MLSACYDPWSLFIFMFLKPMEGIIRYTWKRYLKLVSDWELPDYLLNDLAHSWNILQWHFLSNSWLNFICVLLAMEFGVNISPKPRIFEQDVKVLRKMKMIGFCSEPMMMFDFYRWNGLSKNRFPRVGLLVETCQVLCLLFWCVFRILVVHLQRDSC